jgi:hypothetical protein
MTLRRAILWIAAAACTATAACTPTPEQACAASVKRAGACDDDLHLPPDPAPTSVEQCLALPAVEREHWLKTVYDRCARASRARSADPARVTNCANLALKHIGCRAVRSSREETRELMRGQTLACITASVSEVQRISAHAEAVCAEFESARGAIDLDALRQLLPRDER